MELDVLKYFLTQGPFAVLFVYLLLSTRKDGSLREQKLMDHNERMVVQLEKNTATLQQIERSLTGLESDVQDLKDRVK
ncbi:BhlA/UviB family holin-like peptide [Brevibacillus daliensis]|uniref:BhlA/UviB family holin-like peptide n=1 Tax=Brevibacillus daliensis TaxID=2892995 RepID=UPI001E2BF9AA|nr:BhlA/UviB family holin-like peptide [Brevibacillus daliensis]